MTQNRTKTAHPKQWALMMSGLLAATLVAGCLDMDGNEPPQAVLEADKETGEVGDTFRFDATKSNDPDGNLSLIRLDFGDGTVKEFYEPSEANVTHSYTDPGDFTVTLTVLDNAGDEPEADSDQAEVFVNEKIPVSAQVASVAPPGGTVSTFANQTFNATDEANSFQVNLSVQSVLVVGETQISVRVVDSNGTELANESVSIPAGGNKTISFDKLVGAPGAHVLEIMARQGSARVTGDILVRYDESGPAA
ncbi:MAG TPA: PKD domain-containing protein [Candidatus Thermoplasmatota archaeon]|nr:PKD domain-containing protein [Candidatus Thermoplasmatota archaeon]